MNKINNLTTEDIHTIRYANYEKTKTLSFSDLIEETAKKVTHIKQQLKKHTLNNKRHLLTFL